MQHGTGAPSAGDLDVQQRFCRRLSRSWLQRVAVGIDLQDLVGVQAALRDSAARHQQPERVTADDDAEVAARAEHPIACIEPPPDLGEPLGRIRGIQRPHDRDHPARTDISRQPRTSSTTWGGASGPHPLGRVQKDPAYIHARS